MDFCTIKNKTKRKRGGKVTATTTRVISQDGKMMTITGVGTDEQGWRPTTHQYSASDRCFRGGLYGRHKSGDRNRQKYGRTRPQRTGEVTSVAIELSVGGVGAS